MNIVPLTSQSLMRIEFSLVLHCGHRWGSSLIIPKSTHHQLYKQKTPQLAGSSAFFSYFLFLPKDTTTVVPVSQPSSLASANVRLGKSFEDIPDFFSSFNRLRNSLLIASSLSLEFFIIRSFTGVLNYQQVILCELINSP